MTQDVFDRAKVLNSEISEPLLSLYCDAAESFVLKYCRLTELPEELYTITAEMAVYNADNADGGGVSSISEGNRSISYTSAATVLGAFKSRLKPFINRAARVPSGVVR